MKHGQLATLTQWTTGNAFLQHALLTLNSNTIPSIPLPEVILGPQKEVFWPTKFFVCSSGTNSSRCCVLGRHILQRPRHLAASNQQTNMAGRHGNLLFLRVLDLSCYYCDLFGGDSYIEKKCVVFPTAWFWLTGMGTPPKTNMEPENGPLEKENRFGNHPFQVPC